jgi:serine/threonine-protein kinase RsbW
MVAPGSERHGEHPTRPRGVDSGAGAQGGAGGKSGERHLKVTIPSDLSASRRVQDQILADVEQKGFNSHSTFAVRLALEEALVNAIKHGNRLDPAKKVHIESRINGSAAEIIIEDEGPGFDRGDIPDPTLCENLERSCGRGILLIESYMHTVEWSKGGRRVRMIRRNQDKALVK